MEELYLNHFEACSFRQGEQAFAHLLGGIYPKTAGYGSEYWTEERLRKLYYWARFRILLGNCDSISEDSDLSTIAELRQLYEWRVALRDTSIFFASCLDQLANLAFYQGENQFGIEVASEARQIKENWLDSGRAIPQQARLDRTLIILGKNLWKNGDFYDALTHYSEAMVEISKHRLEAKHARGRIACLMAQTFLDLRKYEEGKKLAELSLKIFEIDGVPGHHIYRAVSLNILGRAHSICPDNWEPKQERELLHTYGKAEEYFDEAEQIFDQIFADQSDPETDAPYPHRYRASLLGNRAVLLSYQARLIRDHSWLVGTDAVAAEKSELLLKTAIDLGLRNVRMRKKTFRSHVHSTLANAYIDLGGYFKDLGQYYSAALSAQAAVNSLYRTDFFDSGRINWELAAFGNSKPVKTRHDWLRQPMGQRDAQQPVSFTRLILALTLKAEALLHYQSTDEGFNPIDQGVQDVQFLVQAYEAEREIRKTERGSDNLQLTRLDKLIRPVYRTAIPLYYEYYCQQTRNQPATQELNEKVFEMWQKAKRLKMLNVMLARLQGKKLSEEHPDLIKPRDIGELTTLIIACLKNKDDQNHADRLLENINLLDNIKDSRDRELRQIRVLKRKEKFYQRANEKGAEDDPEYRKDFSIKELLKDFQKGDRGCIVSYFIIYDQIYVALVYSAGQAQQFQFLRLATPEPCVRLIPELVNRLSQAFNDPFWDNPKEIDLYKGQDRFLAFPSIPSLSHLNHTIRRCTRELYEYLFRELDEILSAAEVKRIYLIPYDQLYLIPFECLGRERDFEKEPGELLRRTWQDLDFLANRYYFSYHPSIAILYNAHKNRGKQQREISFDGESHGNYEPVRFLQLVVDGKPRDGYFETDPAEPHFSDTVRSLDYVFRFAESRLIVRPRGKHKKISQRLLYKLYNERGGYNIVHVGMHTQPEDPDRPGGAQALVVGNQLPGQDRTRTLWRREDIEKNWTAPHRKEPILLLLNTCRGGAGEINEERAMDSLQSAFLQIGVKNVYYTLCRMNIYFSQCLIKEFLNTLIETAPGEQNFGKAMQAAKLAMIKHEDYGHPRKWAPAVFSGDHLQSLG